VSDREWLQFCIDEARHFRQDGKADALERIAAALNAQAGVVEALVKAAEMACEAMCKDKLYVQTHARLRNALAAVRGETP
jgi:hypothetical protein